MIPVLGMEEGGVLSSSPCILSKKFRALFPAQPPISPLGYPCTQMSNPEISSGKRNVVLYLDPHLVHEAKDRGINLSRFLEYDLRLFFSRLNEPNSDNSPRIENQIEADVYTRTQNLVNIVNPVGWRGGAEFAHQFTSKNPTAEGP